MSVKRRNGSGPRRRGVASPGGEDPVLRPFAFARLDKRLFDAWRSGNPAARSDAWIHLWSLAYTIAVRYCRRFARDDETAKDFGAMAITDAWMDIDRRLREGETWKGESKFAGLLTAHVIYRCRDQCRAFVRSISILDELLGVPADERDERLEAAAPVPPSQGNRGLLIARTREEIRDLVVRLAGLRERRRKRKVLMEAIDAMLAYVRECFAQAVPDGVETASMTLDELVERADPDAFEASKSDMYAFIMKRLKLGRNAFYQQMADLHELLDNERSREADRTRRPDALCH